MSDDGADSAAAAAFEYLDGDGTAPYLVQPLEYAPTCTLLQYYTGNGAVVVSRARWTDAVCTWTPGAIYNPRSSTQFLISSESSSICQVSLICLPDLGLLLLGLKATTMSYPPPGQQAYPPPPPAYAAPPPMAAGYPPQQDSKQVPGNTNDHNCLKAW
jgi:hypothetical protein